MKHSELQVVLDILHDNAIEQRRKKNIAPVPYVLGDPSVGKTQAVYQFGQRVKKEVIVNRLASKDVPDTIGGAFPNRDTRMLEWFRTEFCRDIITKPVIGFLDEFPQAMPLVQNTFSEIMLEGTIDGKSIHPDAFIVLAGNRQSNKAYTHELGSHLKERIIVCDLHYDFEEHYEYMVIHNARPEVLAFMKVRQGVIGKWDKDQQHTDTKEDPDNTGSGTARRLEFCSQLLDRFTPKTPKGVRRELIYKTLGKGLGTEFVALLEKFIHIPPYESIINDPLNTTVPQAMDIAYATVSIIGNRVEATHMDAVVTYLDRMELEFASIAIKNAILRNPELRKTTGFIRWATKNDQTIRTY